MLEKERKFLFKGNLNAFGIIRPITQDIQQAYLMLDAGQQLRVRIIGNQNAWLTYKYDVSPDVKDEFEFSIPIRDGRNLFDRAKYKLSKRRYIIKHSDPVICIDSYPDGLKVVEIEYLDTLHDEDIPDYCGEEITGKAEYSNISIAMRNEN